MSDFMMKQMQGLLSSVSDNLEELGERNDAQVQTILGAIDDLAANVFATQAILVAMLEKNPVDADQVLAWIRDLCEKNGTEAPKAEAMAELLLRGE